MDRKDSSVYAGCLCVRLPLTIIWIIIAMDQVTRFLLSVGLYYRINKKREQTMNAV